MFYKGTLPDGREVAVKRFWEYANAITESYNGLEILPALQHPNIVKLYGFCSTGSKTFLVYEYLQNGNLSDALHGKALQLDWETRYKICLELAKVLAYLHEESMPRIIHGDVNPCNVLLDWNLNPKICDFGEARIFPDGYIFTLAHLLEKQDETKDEKKDACSWMQ